VSGLCRGPVFRRYSLAMGMLDKLRRKAERGRTDAVIELLRKSRPDLLARGVDGLCNEGEVHYGVIVRWRDSGWALMIRCHPYWYAQELSDRVGRELIHTNDPKGTSSYLVARLQSVDNAPIAPAMAAPFEFASLISRAVPRGNFPPPRGR